MEVTALQEEALFDLKKDSYEIDNVRADNKNRGILGALRKGLREWKKR